jgi:lysophospholipase L1-like esterase
MNAVTPIRVPATKLPAAVLSLFLSLLAGAVCSAAEPMPVPAAVAIARPSESEIERARESLRTFLSGADAGTRAIADRYPDLIAVRPPRANPAVLPSLSNNATVRRMHAENIETANRGDIDLLLVGDSITDFWDREGPAGEVNPASSGKAVYDRLFAGIKVANFGISGDTTQGVLYRLINGEGRGFQPKAIMVMIGTNNAATYSSAEIAEGVGAVILELQKDFPGAKILLLGIFPRAGPGDVIRATALGVNPIIARLADNERVFYMDIGDRFLAADGTIPPEIMADRLHPTQRGYEIWADAVQEKLNELLR